KGKNNPTYTPHVDTGDNVIVINAAEVKLTGKKAADKIYYRHSDYPGGLKQKTAGERRANEPEKLVEDSIKGMLPHTPLGRKMGMK
ncbi:50S ribosomal protein L13, partial [Bifidobacterium longum]|nr:50S ribosomal protein L13 [Bifidobacterium longum]